MTSRAVSVVTGAASGMGRACAERLLAPDSLLLVADRSQDIADVAKALQAQAGDGTEVEAIRCDVTDDGDVAALAARVEAAGRLRSLVHAAGVSPTMGDWRTMFAVDLVGTALVVETFRPLAGAGAAAVCIASSAAHQVQLVGGDFTSIVEDPLDPALLSRLADTAFADNPDAGMAYSWAKRGIVLLVQREAAAWGAQGARICSVSPGIIDTPMGRLEMANQPMMSVMIDHIPLGRQGTAGEVAAVVAFLLSDEAAYMTGCDVLVDGGVVPTLSRALTP